MKTKVLITGANGLVGQKLVRLFVEKSSNYEIFATSKGENRIQGIENLAYYPLDLTNKKATEEVLQALQPDIIIHTAAMTQADPCELDQPLAYLHNVEVVKTLVEIAARQPIFLLHLSTDFIFSGEDNGLYTEDAQPAPVNYYGQTKWEAEQVILQSTINHAIARTVLVYGINPHMSRSNIISWVKNNLDHQKPIRVVNDQIRTPTLAEDLAQGCFLIIERKATGIFHLSGKEALTPYQMAIKTADFFGLDKSLITPTNANEFKEIARRPLRTGFTIAKAEKELGYQPHSFDEGIAILDKQMR